MCNFYHFSRGYASGVNSMNLVWVTLKFYTPPLLLLSHMFCKDNRSVINSEYISQTPMPQPPIGSHNSTHAWKWPERLTTESHTDAHIAACTLPRNTTSPDLPGKIIHCSHIYDLRTTSSLKIYQPSEVTASADSSIPHRHRSFLISLLRVIPPLPVTFLIFSFSL